jgi:hypothetical protein
MYFQYKKGQITNTKAAREITVLSYIITFDKNGFFAKIIKKILVTSYKMNP